MAKLSKKQQRNIEDLWLIEGYRKELDIRIADLIRPLLEEAKAWDVMSNELDDQVPESVRNTWDEVDSDRQMRWHVTDEYRVWKESLEILRKASR
jgi:tRNA A37 N6-isopentenylltransferase MiaA